MRRLAGPRSPLYHVVPTHRTQQGCGCSALRARASGPCTSLLGPTTAEQALLRQPMEKDICQPKTWGIWRGHRDRSSTDPSATTAIYSGSTGLSIPNIVVSCELLEKAGDGEIVASGEAGPGVISELSTGRGLISRGKWRGAGYWGSLFFSGDMMTRPRLRVTSSISSRGTNVRPMPTNDIRTSRARVSNMLKRP